MKRFTKKINPVLKAFVLFFFILSHVATAAEIYYYHNDHLGTPQVMTDENADIVWQADYTPFGKADVVVETITNNIRFPGQYFDKETGLHYNYYRDYDPLGGSYIQSDPIGLAGGINTYAYVYGNPVNWYDPDGLRPTTPTQQLKNQGFSKSYIQVFKNSQTKVLADISGYNDLVDSADALMCGDYSDAMWGVAAAMFKPLKAIERLGIDPNLLNRTHNISGKRSSKNVNRISDSMRKDGYQGDGIDVVEHNGELYIIDGHHRAAAARRTGTPVNVNVINNLSNHPSNYNTIKDVLESAASVGGDGLRL